MSPKRFIVESAPSVPPETRFGASRRTLATRGGQNVVLLLQPGPGVDSINECLAKLKSAPEGPCRALGRGGLERSARPGGSGGLGNQVVHGACGEPDWRSRGGETARQFVCTPARFAAAGLRGADPGTYHASALRVTPAPFRATRPSAVSAGGALKLSAPGWRASRTRDRRHSRIVWPPHRP